MKSFALLRPCQGNEKVQKYRRIRSANHISQKRLIHTFIKNSQSLTVK